MSRSARIGKTRFFKSSGADSTIEDHRSRGSRACSFILRRRDPGGRVGPGAMAMRHGAAMDIDGSMSAAVERVLGHQRVDGEQDRLHAGSRSGKV